MPEATGSSSASPKEREPGGKRPLFGRRVVVTRPRRQARELVCRLGHFGAVAVEVPVIEIDDPDDGGAGLRMSALELASGAYEWVVVTSVNGARRLLAVLGDDRDLGGAQVAAIGPSTAAALRKGHLAVDLVAPEAVAESLLEVFPSPPVGGAVLLARAAEARDVLPDGLASRRWRVKVVDAYRTRVLPLDAARKSDLNGADAVTFTSSSTVVGLVDAIGVDLLPPVVACIGPVTAATAKSLGVTVAVEATDHTIAGLVNALVAYWTGDLASDRPAG